MSDPATKWAGYGALYEAEKLKQARAKEPSQSRSTLEQISRVEQRATLEPSAPEPLNHSTVEPHARVESRTRVEPRTTVNRGYTSAPNDLWDTLMPTLHVYDQVLLQQLYRLSRGFGKETCRIGLETLAKRCNCSSRQIQKSADRLEQRGLINRLGAEFGHANKALRGTEYKINVPGARIERHSTVEQHSRVEQSASLEQYSTNKEHTIKDTHNTEGVRVGSRFALAECRRYAESLRADGITNPGGYATKIHRSGEADDLIAAFLNPAEAAPMQDVSQCPDCGGTGFWEPGGVGKGVAKCRHERLSPHAD